MTLIRGRGGRVPVPTDSEFREAIDLDREIVACSAKRFGPLIALKVAFHNGDTSTVSVSTAGGFHLLRALKAIVPDGPTVGAAALSGDEIQEGHMSG